jgi:hypothetical protein
MQRSLPGHAFVRPHFQISICLAAIFKWRLRLATREIESASGFNVWRTRQAFQRSDLAPTKRHSHVRFESTERLGSVPGQEGASGWRWSSTRCRVRKRPVRIAPPWPLAPKGDSPLRGACFRREACPARPAPGPRCPLHGAFAFPSATMHRIGPLGEGIFAWS